MSVCSSSEVSTPKSSKTMSSVSVRTKRNSVYGSTSTKNGAAAAGSNIQVAARCRPLNNEEKQADQASVVTCDLENNVVKIAHGPANKKTLRTVEFDRVFGMYSRQSEVYEAVVKPIVTEAISGYNCTVFAYGPTGTGKTYTMEGDLSDEGTWGMIPRAAKTIFESLDAVRADYAVKISYLEIYNEELQDLLSNATDKRLKLMEDLKRGVICHNLEEVGVNSIQEVNDWLKKGVFKRTTAATLLNQASSRSHAIFTFRVLVTDENDQMEEVIRQGQLNLVDLAGSENIARSGAKDAREAGNINQSLLTLGRVITALTDMHPHVPYRDSKLTRLLQESLGGKAKTCILATLSPSQLAVDETLSTLEYATRARSIRNSPTLNTQEKTRIAMKEYHQEIEILKQQLLVNRERNGVYVETEKYYSMENKLSAQENMIAECENTIKQREKEILYLTDENAAFKANYERLDNLYKELEGKHKQLEETSEKQAQLIVQQTQQIEELTAENEHLIDKVYNLENTVAAQQAKIEALEAEVARLERENRYLFVEYCKQTAVIEEQIVTEKKLTALSDELQVKLHSKQDEINTLLSKISTMEASEQARDAVNKEYFQSLYTALQSLTQHVQAQKAQLSTDLITSTDSITALYANYQTVLNTFKAAQCEAIVVLQEHVQKQSREEEEGLANVQKKHDDRLAQVVESLSKGQAEADHQLVVWKEQLSKLTDALHLQQQQTTEFASALELQTKDFNSFYSTYTTLTQQQQEAFSAHITAAQASFLTAQQHNKTLTHSQLSALQSSLQSKFLTMQQTMESLFTSCLAEHQQQVTQLATHTDTSYQHMSTAFTDHNTGIVTRYTDMSHARSEKVDQHRTWYTTSHSANVNKLTAVAGSNTTMETQAQTVLAPALSTLQAHLSSQAQAQAGLIKTHVGATTEEVASVLKVGQAHTAAVQSQLSALHTGVTTYHTDKLDRYTADSASYQELTGKLSVTHTDLFSKREVDLKQQEDSGVAHEGRTQQLAAEYAAQAPDVKHISKQEKARHDPFPATRAHQEIRGDVGRKYASANSENFDSSSGSALVPPPITIPVPATPGGSKTPFFVDGNVPTTPSTPSLSHGSSHHNMNGSITANTATVLATTPSRHATSVPALVPLEPVVPLWKEALQKFLQERSSDLQQLQ